MFFVAPPRVGSGGLMARQEPGGRRTALRRRRPESEALPPLVPPEIHGELTTFRDRLRWAMSNILPPTRLNHDGTPRPWTTKEVCDLIAEGLDCVGDVVDTGRNFDGTKVRPGQKSWYAISPTYMNELLNAQRGQSDNPTLAMLHMFGTFFCLGAPFFVESNVAHAQLIAASVRHVRVEKALRAAKPAVDSARPQLLLLSQRGDVELSDNLKSLLSAYDDILDQLGQYEDGAGEGDTRKEISS